MQLKMAPNDVQSMAQDGDAILRSLQNNRLPEIDLMVRESLQNSLDASQENMENTNVSFTVSEFESSMLASHLEEVQSELNERFSGKQEFIAISDKNTSGLTGDFISDDQEVLNKSNFHKLVFGIGKNQSKEGAGGSWGLGKTSYFRMGVGIVFYYTRVQMQDGSFEERLIASLIESPKSEVRILPKSERGIAWWGEYDETGEKILPITNSADISNILKIFNLKNYDENETGTTIIIPYLNEYKSNESGTEVPWENSREEEIEMAVQRWYFPRISNQTYFEKLGNSKLYCSVNGKLISDEFLPNLANIFVLFKDVYNSALIGKAINEKIVVKEVVIPREALKTNGMPIGHIAFIEVSRDEAGMTPPNNNFSPLAYFGVKDKNKIENHNSKVIAYCRKPGMVVEFDVDGDWSPTENVQKDNHMLIGFFVPCSASELSKGHQDKGYLNVESYLRATENSDHANWEDEHGVTLIQRTKKYLLKAIRDNYQENNDTARSSATSGLSRKFGKQLMPPKNYGKASRGEGSKPKPNGDNQKSKLKRNEVNIISTNLIDASHVKVDFEISLKEASKSKLFVQINSQDGYMDNAIWSKVFGESNQFPFSIKELSIEKENEILKIVSEEVFAELTITRSQDDPSSVYIHYTGENNTIVKGSFILETQSIQYIPVLSIKSESPLGKGN